LFSQILKWSVEKLTDIIQIYPFERFG